MSSEVNGTNWSMDDVEILAQHAIRDTQPPAEIVHRLGEQPDDEFLKALGRRMYELYQERGE